jgi:hypothetical protein
MRSEYQHCRPKYVHEYVLKMSSHNIIRGSRHTRIMYRPSTLLYRAGIFHALVAVTPVQRQAAITMHPLSQHLCLSSTENY